MTSKAPWSVSYVHSRLRSSQALSGRKKGGPTVSNSELGRRSLDTGRNALQIALRSLIFGATAPIPPSALRPQPGPVVQECPDDAGDTEADVDVDGSELMYQALSVDRSEQLALDVAGFVEPILAGRLNFDMERKSSSGCR